MPPKRTFTLSEDVRPKKAAKRQKIVRTIPQGGVNEGSLCSHCQKVDLTTMFSKETNAKDLGFLGKYMDPACPFCTIIWDCIRLHWKSASPLNHGARPRLFIQSKQWGWVLPHGAAQGHLIHCILLAITVQPPDFRVNRRIISTDKQNRFILAELELLNSTSTQGSAAHMLRRRIEERLDIDTLRRWLKNCEQHEHKANTDLELFRGGFRLIDVDEVRLVEKTEPCEYLALSYVWGSHDPHGLKTTRTNLKFLKGLHALENSLQSIGKRVPRTIADAMSLCKDIGHRYLWVDCLCIVQDDEEEKRRLIHGMGHVYENASLTLFAISGQHADTGLAGITPREDFPYEKQYDIKGQDILLSILITPISLEEQVRKSPWNTRAWTLQEQTLSGKRLYFTANEVFFDCSNRMLRECYNTESFETCYITDRSPFWGRGRRTGVYEPLVAMLPKGESSLWTHDDYASMVSSYSRRELSYTDDVLNALSGIYDRCTLAHQPQRPILAMQGLNDASFAKSLLWFIAEPDPAKVKRRYKVHETKLASWSWASWVAPIDFVCIYESSFPVPQIDNRHGAKYCPFVTEWTLTNSNENGISETTIKTEGRDKTSRVPGYYDFFFDPDRFMAILPSKPQLLSLANGLVGSLRFVAPCITFPAGFRLVTDAKISKGGHLLVLPNQIEYHCVIKFDADDKAFTEFLLIMYDGHYVALCVSTEGDTSRRIGVAQFSNQKKDWETALEEGLLHLAWKQVCLV
ncbi:heterokaryon incompatibility protein-domain-containing protein [Paraphoma chrysanthemicola]|uniref:Heterokaryon incompatibility protein-domain-containing protein n=1 Tax=Paraphoma chrysanthemicola TaxID=798071 RepID=A0A8K0RM79_9PLEO|nr:heterokaryon incompatibility protein-domain-containing protein [Paraphoma chrysanthemicola]